MSTTTPKAPAVKKAPAKKPSRPRKPKAPEEIPVLTWHNIKYVNGSLTLTLSNNLVYDGEATTIPFVNNSPTEDFEDALQSLVVDLVELDELPKAAATQVEVREVDFHHEGDSYRVQIKGVYRYKRSKGTRPINAPHRWFRPGVTKGASDRMSKQLKARLDALMQEAEMFLLEGKRAQLELPLGVTTGGADETKIHKLAEAVPANG